jgi:hypothetical protein
MGYFCRECGHNVDEPPSPENGGAEEAGGGIK